MAATLFVPHDVSGRFAKRAQTASSRQTQCLGYPVTSRRGPRPGAALRRPDMLDRLPAQLRDGRQLRLNLLEALHEQAALEG